MKIPQCFIPKGNFDKKIEESLRDRKIRDRKIKDIFSLMDLPLSNKGYVVMRKARTVPLDSWQPCFGDLISKYLIEAGEVEYRNQNSVYFIGIYALKFANKYKLDELIRQTNISHEFLEPNHLAVAVQCLKRDYYMASIHLNKEIINDMKIFEDWYITNFGMEKI